MRASKVVTDVIQATSIRYNNRVYEMKRRGEDVIVMSLGEAHFDIPLFSFDDLPYPDMYHYSHSRGILDLRQKLAQYFESEYSFKFDPETDIIVTAGSKAAIHMAFMSILDPGDEVLIWEPYWVSYTEQVKLCYGVPVTVPYQVSVFEYEKYITDRTRCIIINNPNNPRGKIFSREELEHLLKLAEKYNLYILSDEAYSDFVLDPSEFHSLGRMDPTLEHSIVCNSISKNYGISGWRLGYVITNAELTNEILKVNQHIITCPATILEYYIAKHFFEIIEITKPQIREIVRTRQRIAEYMDSIGLTYLPGNATFYFLVSIEDSSLGSEAFCTRLLDEFKVCAVPGLGYGKSCDHHIRVSVGTEPWDRMIKAIDSIRELIDLTRVEDPVSVESMIA